MARTSRRHELYPDAEKLFEDVARRFGMTSQELRKEKRSSRSGMALKLFCKELKERNLDCIPSTQLGIITNRDHTTVLHFLTFYGTKVNKIPNKEEEELIRDMLKYTDTNVSEIRRKTNFCEGSIRKIAASLKEEEVEEEDFDNIDIIEEVDKINKKATSVQMKDFESALREEAKRYGHRFT